MFSQSIGEPRRTLNPQLTKATGTIRQDLIDVEEEQ